MKNPFVAIRAIFFLIVIGGNAKDIIFYLEKNAGEITKNIIFALLLLLLNIAGGFVCGFLYFGVFLVIDKLRNWLFPD